MTQARPLRMTVIGTGYLGATHAACMAELGYEVLGIDVDDAKVKRLSTGEVPFFEPGLDEVLRRGIESGRLRFSSSFQEATDFADMHFICVGTPQRIGSYAADLTQVHAAVDALGSHLSRPSLVIGKSTVPVGTASQISTRLATLCPGTEVAWNPEFLREGFAVQDTLSPDRIVIGVRSESAADRLKAVYEPLLAQGIPLVETDFETAELVKVAANAFLATKISFINAMAEVCEAAGADVVQLAEAIGHDPRIGNKFLQAGLGFGGGCLPKDIRAFMARAGELGVDQALTFLREVDEINYRRRQRTVDLARSAVGGRFLHTKVAVLGAAFKPNSDDVRDSPALHVAAAIHTEGADVVVHDPKAIDNARAIFPNLDYSEQIEDTVIGADVILHLTEWREYRDLDPVALSALTAGRHIIDGRNTLDASTWRAAGWTYRALGRPLS